MYYDYIIIYIIYTLLYILYTYVPALTCRFIHVCASAIRQARDNKFDMQQQCGVLQIDNIYYDIIS